jgi:hypothetical protein
MLTTYTDNALNSMFQSLLAQHLDVGPTGGPMISSGGGFGGGGYDPRKTLDGADITNPVDFLSSIMGRINSYYDNYVGLLRENGFGPSAKVFERGIQVWSNSDFSSFKVINSPNSTSIIEGERTFSISAMLSNPELHLEMNWLIDFNDPGLVGLSCLIAEIHFHPEFTYGKMGIIDFGTKSSGTTMTFPINPSPLDWEKATYNQNMKYQFNPTHLILRGNQMYQYGYDRSGNIYERQFQWRKN